MSLYSEINKLAKVPPQIRGLRSLETNKLYKVVKVKRSKTNFGERIEVELEEFRIYLGERYNQLTEEQLLQMNKDAEEDCLCLVSHGFIGQVVDLEFKKINE